MIPCFLLGLIEQFNIFPYFSSTDFIFSSVTSDLKPPKKAMGLYFEANGLRTKVRGGLSSRAALKLFKAFSPASMFVKVTMALLAWLLSCSILIFSLSYPNFLNSF